MAAVRAGGVDRIEQQCAGAALHQLKRPGNRVLAALLGKAGFNFALGVPEHIQPQDVGVARLRVNAAHDAVRGQLYGLDNAVLVVHKLGQCGKIAVTDFIPGLNDAFQQLGLRQVAVELGLHIGDGGLRRVGRLELFAHDDAAGEKCQRRQQHKKHEDKDENCPFYNDILVVSLFHIFNSLWGIFMQSYI